MKLFFIISVCIAGIIILQWFGQHRIIATAEEGIPFANAIKTCSLYKSVWIDQEFGFAIPFYIPRLVFYCSSGLLQQIGFSPWVTQAIWFFVIIVTPLISFPLLFKELFPKINTIQKFIPGIFYVFNLFTLSQIFERFIYPLMFLWSFLPLFLFLWIRYINSRRILYLGLLLVFSLLFSDVFGLTSSFIVLSFVALLYLLIKVLSEKHKWDVFLYGVVGFIIWSISQAWWILPIWDLRNDSFSGYLNSSGTLNSLLEVSKFYPITQILYLKQNYYFGPGNFLYHFYSHMTVIGISFGIFLITIVGILVARKQKLWRFVFILFLVGFFISKGANPPLGKEFFQGLFTLFPFTQILRNPYEKFGVVFLLPYAIFFSFGIMYISTFTKKFKFILLGLILFVTCYYLVWPLWNGEIFANRVRISVPSSYKKANYYLDKQGSNRILQLPLLEGPAIEYTWGYHGEESSEFLFDRPSLSRSDFGKPADEFYLLFPQYLSNPYFSNVLRLANIGAIVVHKDYLHNPLIEQSSSDSQSNVEHLARISTRKDFGDLTVYTLQEKTTNWVYAVHQVQKVNNVKQGLDKIINPSFDPLSTGILVTSQNKILPEIPKLMKQPSVSFTKLSSTHYLIMTKATTPYLLIFSHSYNLLWNAYIDNEVVTNHFTINGFANAWVIKKTGSYTIDLRFDAFSL